MVHKRQEAQGLLHPSDVQMLFELLSEPHCMHTQPAQHRGVIGATAPTDGSGQEN